MEKLKYQILININNPNKDILNSQLRNIEEYLKWKK